jgi:L-ribulose-5-phosphate 4-epimerase
VSDGLGLLRAEVCEANVELARRGLAKFTFGNASAIDRDRGLIVIKPSGVGYAQLRPDMLTVVNLDGEIVEGALRPSSDLPTHVVLYRALAHIGGIVHTHSHYATVWAQACREIPCFGTTHADYFHGAIPVTQHLEHSEIESEYERNTGEAIIRRLAGCDPLRMSAVLVAGHASFCWGLTVEHAVETASLLEAVAHMAYDTAMLNHSAEPIPGSLLDKHFFRKHGPDAYYGQASTTIDASS